MKIPFRGNLSDVEFRRYLVNIINGRINFADNIECRQIEVVDTGGANVEFQVLHGLGRKPISYFYNIDRAGLVYDSNRASWDDTYLTLKCTVAHAVLNLVVI